MSRASCRILGFVLLSIVSMPDIAPAYLASPAELRNFWERERTLNAPLLLSFSDRSGKYELEIMLYPDGTWARTIRNGQRQQTVWKRGLDAWRLRDGTWIREPRHISWEDWGFEPDIEVLLAMTPAELLLTRGLGRHPEGYAWLYGARSDRAPAPWFGLLPDPLRLAIWNSTHERIGRVEYRYEGKHRYPDHIRFDRGRDVFSLHRTSTRWNPPKPLAPRIPAAIAATPPNFPPRPEDVTRPTP